MSKKDDKKGGWKADDKLTMVFTKADTRKTDKSLTMDFQEVHQKKSEKKE